MPQFPSLASPQPHQNATFTVPRQAGGTSPSKAIQIIWLLINGSCQISLRYRDLSPASSRVLQKSCKEFPEWDTVRNVLFRTRSGNEKIYNSHGDNFKRPFYTWSVTVQKDLLCLCSCFQEKKTNKQNKLICWWNSRGQVQKHEESQKEECLLNWVNAGLGTVFRGLNKCWDTLDKLNNLHLETHVFD